MGLTEQKRYNEVYRLENYSSYRAAQGPKHIPTVLKIVGKDIKSILDVGCGPGHSVRDFLKKGYDCKGVETSDFLMENALKDLVESKRVFKMSASNLDFPDNSFDLVFCTDVMEHIPIGEVKKSIEEISRVSKKYMFFTISSSPSDFHEDGKDLHITIRPRQWWVRIIEKFGHSKLISPNFIMNKLINNKTRRWKLVRKKDYFLFKKIK